jgi:hypothetical protein
MLGFVEGNQCAVFSGPSLFRLQDHFVNLDKLI